MSLLLANQICVVHTEAESSGVILKSDLSDGLRVRWLPMSDTCFANLSGSSVTTWAQLVKRLSKKTGAILTRVRVPGAARDFSPRVNFRCRLSYGVRTAPVCCRMHQHLCARKNPKHLQPYLLLLFFFFFFFFFWTHENTAHTDRNG